MNRLRLFGPTLVCGVLLAGSARHASADPITFQFDGVLTGVPAELTGDFAVGDAFSYTLGLDMASLFNGSYSPWLDFAGSVGGWDFQGTGGGTFYSTPTSILGELHHFHPTLITSDPLGASDQYRALGAFSTWTFDPGVLTPGVLDGTLPLPAPTTASLRILFGYRPDPVNSPLLWVNGPELMLSGTATSSVPEPSTFLFMLTALGGVVGRRAMVRRRA
jgi:hypothetical protein